VVSKFTNVTLKNTEIPQHGVLFIALYYQNK